MFDLIREFQKQGMEMDRLRERGLYVVGNTYDNLKHECLPETEVCECYDKGDKWAYVGEDMKLHSMDLDKEVINYYYEHATEWYCALVEEWEDAFNVAIVLNAVSELHGYKPFIIRSGSMVDNLKDWFGAIFEGGVNESSTII